MNYAITEETRNLFIECLTEHSLDEWKFVIKALNGEELLEDMAVQYLKTCSWDKNPATSTTCALLDAYICYKTNIKYDKGKDYAIYLSERGGVISKTYKNELNEHNVLSLSDAISMIDRNYLFDDWLEKGGRSSK
jgi:hypothetical protein